VLTVLTATSHRLAVCAAVTLVSFAAWSGAPEDEIVGSWFDADKDVQIEISARVSKQGTKRYYGRIVWLREPYYDGPGEEYGDPLRDARNPHVARRNEPILGIEILKNFEYNPRKKWWKGGTGYDPESGKTYRSVLSLKKDSSAEGGVRLILRGYVFVRLIGRSTTWTRVPEDWVAPDPVPLPPRKAR